MRWPRSSGGSMMYQPLLGRTPTIPCAASCVSDATPTSVSAEQAKIVPIETAPFVVVRLLMPPGNRYEERRDALAPFNRLSAPDDGMRREVAALAQPPDDVAVPRAVAVVDLDHPVLVADRQDQVTVRG